MEPNAEHKNGIYGISNEELKAGFEEVFKRNSDGYISENLRKVLETQEKLKATKAREIKFAAPVLRQGDNAVIFPHTINVIQGQAGVHKSRLAETICAAILRRAGAPEELLGLKRNDPGTPLTVVYVDTERNLTEQFPYALQSIQLKAGFHIDDHPDEFEYISLLHIERKSRFQTLDEYLQHLRKKTSNPLFIVLDVSTDCIEDFNRPDKSMELIDLMNVAINEHNVIFLCIIHENPKSDKARGHFGTELMNKATTVMQVGFEKDRNQDDTNIIRVKYLKCRSTARFEPFYARYADNVSGLVLADAGDISEVRNSRKLKAPIDDVAEQIELYLGNGITLTRTELLPKLCEDFQASPRTIADRISELIDSETEMFNELGQSCKLSSEIIKKEAHYKLILNEPY